MNKTLVPFSVDTYKPGDKVITRDGRPVEIFTTKRNSDKYPVVGELMGIFKKWTKNGKFSFSINTDHDADIFIEKERQLIPFDMSDAESIIGKAVKHKVNDRFSLITDFASFSTGNYIQVGTSMIRPSTLLNNFVFLDGSPCGKYA